MCLPRRTARPNAGGSRASLRGFTLLELMIVVTILGVIASVGVPQYVSALRTARVGKARHELVNISHAIDSFAATHGSWPLTLHQVGFGGRRDPWGLPYCYLNYADGTGDGLDWALRAGLVDPGAFQSASATTVGGGAAGGGSAPKRLGRAITAPRPQGGVVLADLRPIDWAKLIAGALPRTATDREVDSLAEAIGANKGFSIFVGVEADTTRRRDRYMFPLNTDYDLFSLGPDLRTSVSLGETVGLDDVIRANNGGFFGVAADY